MGWQRLVVRYAERLHALAWGLLLASCVGLGGCASSEWIRLRHAPQNPLVQPLQLLSWSGPQATPRTLQLLRRYDLQEQLRGDSQSLLREFQNIVVTEPTSEHVYALAELSYICGKRADRKGNRDEALDMYGAAVGNAYMFLLDPRFDWERNPYDPQFRRACDLYNSSMESVLRLISHDGRLELHGTIPIRTATQTFDVKVVPRGQWHRDEFEYFRFVSDYELEGLTNVYRTYGLGVPLIGVHNPRHRHDAGGPFYPPGVSSSVTAFLRVLSCENGCIDAARRNHDCVLEIYNSARENDTVVHQRRVPLETDLSTPLAYALNNPFFKETDRVTRGLLKPRDSQSVAGVYMLQPYDPDKIPVLMVHGLWSSLTTWMEMFNDLQGSERIRQQYQFWFYQYPTGQSFLISAAHLRQELQRIRTTLDPHHSAPALDQMVLVAHSMGGLIADLQVIDSGDDFWRLVSEQPLDSVEMPQDVRDYLNQTLYFSSNPSIKRIVTIATPHSGSTLSNSATQWLGRRLILPPEQHALAREILSQRAGVLRDGNLLSLDTSIETLSPTNPALPVIQRARQPAAVTFHNVVGRLPSKGVLGYVAGDGDGVVGFESAHLEGVASELVVAADHVDIHRHPRTVLEVRRVLLDHLGTAGDATPRRLTPVSVADATDTRRSPEPRLDEN